MNISRTIQIGYESRVFGHGVFFVERIYANNIGDF